MNEHKDRITIMLSKDTTKKVRSIQSKLIVDSNGSVSFSRVLEALVKAGVKRQLRSKEPLLG